MQRISAILVVITTLGCVAAHLRAADPPKQRKGQDTAGLGGRTGQWPVDLKPDSPQAQQRVQRFGRIEREVELGGWAYRAERNPQPADSVPWRLHARPIGENERTWRPASSWALVERTTAIPVIRVPPVLWDKWVDPTMRDVVGIHFHELTTRDLARVLITVHEVSTSADRSDDAWANRSVVPRRATRLEATLMTPVTFRLEQSIAILADPKDEATAKDREDHERGHGAKSLEAMLTVLAGPQTWSPQRSTGRRSTLAWYWKSEKLGRRWEAFREGQGELLTLRTSIALVPPTRWSKLLPKPPEALEPEDIRTFNEELVHLDAAFVVADRQIQEAFHAEHGAYEDRRRK